MSASIVHPYVAVVRLGYPCMTLGIEPSSMRGALLSRYDKGLVELAPIYAYNMAYAERSVRYSLEHGLAAFRISSDTFPLLDYAKDARDLVPSAKSLRALVQSSGIHVSSHPSQFIVLSSAEARVVDASRRALEAEAWMMKRIGATGSITFHGGGIYGDRRSAGARLAANIELLPKNVRTRIALENDERMWTTPELAEATHGAVPIVFDVLHWAANERSIACEDELRMALASWPTGRIAELHYSEQAEGKVRGAHSEWITGKGLLRFARQVVRVAKGREVTIIVEAKKKDLAIARALDELDARGRRELVDIFPDLARAPRDWWKALAAKAAA